MVERTKLSEQESLSVPAYAEDEAGVVDWASLVEASRSELKAHNLARSLLEIGRTMTRAAGHMFVLGEYLIEQKAELGHGNFTAWV